MLPHVSPVQKCPYCGKYYLEYKQKGREGDKHSSQLGTLSYPELKEAYYQFLEEMENSDEHKQVSLRTLYTFTFCSFKPIMTAIIEMLLQNRRLKNMPSSKESFAT